MPTSGPRVLATALADLDELMRVRNGPPLSEILAEAGVDRSANSAPNQDISLESYARILETCGRAIGEECFGLHYAKVFPIGGTRVLGYLMRNAPDLRTFVGLLERFLPIQTDGIAFRFHDGLAPRVSWTLPSGFLAPRKQLVEFLIVLFVLRVRTSFGEDFRPVSAEFEYRRPGCMAEYEDIFGRNITFEAGGNSLGLRPDALALRNENADELLFETMRAVAEEKLVALERSREGVRGVLATDLLQRLTDHIIKALGSDDVGLESAAKALRMSPRELQSELRRRHTSFAQELSSVRRGLAERYLRDTLMPISDIALQLGFSELSAFTRAARGWFGISPSAWRKQERASTRLGARRSAGKQPT